MFNRIFGRKQVDEIFSDNFDVDTSSFAITSHSIYKYLNYLIYDTFFGDHESGYKFKDYVQSEPKSVEEIISYMEWNNTIYTRKFIPRIFKSLSEVIVTSKDQEIKKYHLKYAVLKPSEDIINDAIENNKLMMLSAEDLLEYAIESLEKGHGIANFKELSTSIVWNSFFDDKLESVVRTECIMSGIQQLKSGKSYKIIDIGSGNGSGALLILQEAFKKEISIDLYIVDYSPVFMQYTRGKIDAWLRKNPEAETMFMVYYLQTDITDDSFLMDDFFEELKFDLVIVTHLLQYLSFSEMLKLLDAIKLRLQSSGRMIYGHHALKNKNNIYLAVILSLDTNYRSFPDETIFIENLTKLVGQVIPNDDKTVITCYF